MSLSLRTVSLTDFTSPDPKAKAFFVVELGAGIRELGFVSVAGAGLPEGLVDATYAAIRDFFALPLEQKRACELPASNGNRGYVTFGKEHAKERKVSDLKEFFYVGRELPELGDGGKRTPSPRSSRSSARRPPGSTRPSPPWPARADALHDGATLAQIDRIGDVIDRMQPLNTQNEFWTRHELPHDVDPLDARINAAMDYLVEQRRPDAVVAAAFLDLKTGNTNSRERDREAFDQAADNALGFTLPHDWTGEVRIVGVMERDGQIVEASLADGPQAYHLYARKGEAQPGDDAFAYLTATPTLAEADALTDRLALIGANSEVNELDKAAKLARAREIFFNSTSLSLVILDELAEGTTFEEKMTLSEYVLKGFHQLGASTLIVTHNHELCERLLSEGIGSYLQVEFLQGEPTHRLIPGISRVSHADRVASAIGFSKADVEKHLESLKS